MIEITTLPTLNALLNSLSAVLLVLGFYFIKKNPKSVSSHKLCMVGAFCVSALFLASYLYYHYHFPTRKFPDLGWIKMIYLTILFTHIILAVVMLPMILTTLWRAYKNDVEKHKKIARITFPIWLYVSVTGVVIYFMLYQWFA